jgi:Domain of unknown function (DUF397)
MEHAPQVVRWTKARRSYGIGECVELAAHGESVLLRDSKSPDTLLRFTRAEIAAFVDGVRKGEFDHLT